MQENSTSDRSLIKRLIRFPILNRIIALKNLFLEKLDILIDNSTPTMVGTTKIIDSLVDLSTRVNLLVQQNNSVHQNISIFLEQYQNLQSKLDQIIQDLESQNSQLESQYHIYQSRLEQISHQLEAQSSQIELQNSQLKEVTKSSRFIVRTDTNGVDADTRLMTYLYSFLPHHRAIDIGANKGDVSVELIKAGYEVYAFEPFPETFSRLKFRFRTEVQFHGFQMALGSMDGVKELFVAEDKSTDHRYKDSSLFNSLVNHSMPDDIAFVDSISVEVRSLKSLHDDNLIPPDIDLVKVDTEGYDLEVLKGMGSQSYPVIVTEFWDKSFPFGQSNAFNDLSEMALEMKLRGYHWFLTLYRVWGSDEISFYCNHFESVKNSWGNVFFFQDHHVFLRAMQWCSAVLRSTYFQ